MYNLLGIPVEQLNKRKGIITFVVSKSNICDLGATKCHFALYAM
jgi:hypothetical protein